MLSLEFELLIRCFIAWMSGKGIYHIYNYNFILQAMYYKHINSPIHHGPPGSWFMGEMECAFVQNEKKYILQNTMLKQVHNY
jgi:hypothetical protein